MSVTSKSQNLEGIFISTLLYKYHICIVVFHQTTKLVFPSAEKKIIAMQVWVLIQCFVKEIKYFGIYNVLDERVSELS